jgi:hypothetical protein
MLLLGAAVGTQLLPIAWAFLPQAMFVGLMSGVAACLLFRVPQIGDMPPKGKLGLVALLLVASMGTRLSAAESLAVPPGVLVPVGADGKEAGSDVYVPESMLKGLLAAEEPGGLLSAGFVLLEAKYDVNLSAADQSEFTCNDCLLKFRFKTFTQNQQVFLPLLKGDGQWLEGSTLDENPVKIQWDGSGRGCAFHASEPGDHLISLRLRPNTTSKNGSREFQLNVPSMSGAIVEVVKPESLIDVTIQSPVLDKGESNRGHLRATLAATRKLSVAWHSGKVEEAQVVVEQLSLLQVEPGAARLTTRLRASSADNALERLILLAAPQLKLLPLDPSSPFAISETSTNTGNRLEVRFREPAPAVATVELEFQVQRTTSIGRIEFPAVKPVGPTVKSNYFAVQINPRLTVHEELVTGLSAVPSAEIQNAWPRVPEQLRLAYSLTANQPAWSIQVEPLPAKVMGTESLNIHCQATNAMWSYRASISQVEGELFIHRLAIPAEMHVKSVAVTANGNSTSMPARFSRPRPDLLCIFLSQPLTAPHVITISGVEPYGKNRRLSVRRIGLASLVASSLQVSITRDDDVTVDVTGAMDADPPKASSAAYDKDIAVSRFSLGRSEDATPELIVSRNDVHISAVSATMIANVDSEPVITCAVEAKVLRGSLDRIRLTTSTNWRGPGVIGDEAKVVSLKDVGGTDRQEIDIRLAKTIPPGETARIKLQGKLSTDADRRLRFPAVDVLNCDAEQKYLVLPAASHEWSKHGVEPARLPASMISDLQVTKSDSAFRIIDSRFNVRWLALPNGLQQACVRLAATRVTMGDSEWAAVSELIIQPGRDGVFSIRMPDQAALVFAAVDDQPVMIADKQKIEWRMSDGSPYLPRLVTVAYRGPLSTREAFHFQLPQVTAGAQRLPIGRSLWHVASNHELNFALPGSDAISSEDFKARSRHERLAAINDAAPLASQMATGDAAQWFTPWLRRLNEGSARKPNPKDPLETNWAKLLQQLESTAQIGKPSNEGPGITEDAIESSDVQADCFETAGDELQLELPHASSIGRWLLAGSLLILGGATYRYRQGTNFVQSFLLAHPVLISSVVGLLWWVALTPRFVGPVIVLYAIASYIKKRRLASQVLARRRRESHPTVQTDSLRLSVPLA